MSTDEENQTVEKTRDWLDRAAVIADIFSKALVPILVLVVGQAVNMTLKNQDVQVELNKLAVKILTTSPEDLGEGQKEIRAWAIKVLEKGSGITFDEKAIETLKQEPLNLGEPSPLSYSDARDHLFAEVYEFNLIGIYTGYKVTLSPESNESPRRAAYRNGINVEHIWPQSKGAKDDAKSDLHNLYPAFVKVNSARSSLRFDEIPDSETTKWFREDEELNTIPSQDINEYSELTTDRFEPRDSVKGDIARTMFYFHSTYQERLNKDEKEYFEQQKTILCQWHELDPVDDSEIIRNNKISAIQGNLNSFITNPDRANREYCSGDKNKSPK